MIGRSPTFSQTNPNPTDPRNAPSLSGEVTNLNNEMSAFEDSVIEGYIEEISAATYSTTLLFTVAGNVTSIYTPGRKIRFNRAGTPTYAMVKSSSFTTPNTTVTVEDGTVPNPIVSVDLGIQALGNTDIVTPTNSRILSNKSLSDNVGSTGSAGQYIKADGGGSFAWTGLIINRGFGFNVPGSLFVTNDLSWNPTSPEAMTATTLYAHVKTAPTGANLIAQIYNITQAKIVATVTITATGTDANNASMTNAAIAQGDVLRCDITQVGSSVVGSDLSLVLEVTQP